MKTEHPIQLYRAWLKDRERSPGTIEKYTRDLARFFRETGGAAPPQPSVPADGPAPLPAPSKEAVAAPSISACWPPRARPAASARC